jgi:hypothetical protein
MHFVRAVTPGERVTSQHVQGRLKRQMLLAISLRSSSDQKHN